VSALVEDALHHFDGSRYVLDAYAVMPNHVHVLMKPLNPCGLPRILHSWKSFSAHRANLMLGRQGAFWQDESFDHVVRSAQQLAFYRKYIEENPSKAQLLDGESRCGRGLGLVGATTQG